MVESTDSVDVDMRYTSVGNPAKLQHHVEEMRCARIYGIPAHVLSPHICLLLHT